MSSAQDLHSSNYDYNLMYLNPAEAGAFLGTVRIQGSHRDQFDAFIEKGYNSQIAQVDMPLAIKFFKRGWAGYGLGVLTDRSGDLGFRNSGLLATLSYHIPLDRKSRRIISAGLSVGRLQRSINNSSAAMFGDALLAGSGLSNDFNLLDQFDESYTDYTLGVKYKQVLSRKARLQVGGAVFHAFNLQKAVGFNNKILRRYSLYGIVDYQLSKNVILQPRLYTSFTGAFFNINLQSLVKYNYQEKITIGLGLGYRLQDALQAIITAEYQGWEFGIAYDVTVSSARIYNSGQGALELGVKKIFTLTQRPKTTRVKICPRL